jgi:hypothetical protein
MTNNDDEEWKSIPFFYTKYKVSDFGRIKNLNGKIIQNINNMVMLTNDNGDRYATSAIRLMHYVWFEECKNLTFQELSHLVVRYKDSNDQNNIVSNTEVLGIKVNDTFTDLQTYKLLRYWILNNDDLLIRNCIEITPFQ